MSKSQYYGCAYQSEARHTHYAARDIYTHPVLHYHVRECSVLQISRPILVVFSDIHLHIAHTQIRGPDNT